MGMIYQRGKTWWIQYYCNGQPIRESSKSEKKMVARELLKQREGEISQGKLPGIYFERTTFDELAGDMLADYRINGKKSIARAQRSVNHLKTFLGGTKAKDITTPKIKNYIEQKQGEGAANASINRELAALKRMLNMGAKQTPPMVDRAPQIPMLQKKQCAQGFFLSIMSSSLFVTLCSII